MECCLAIWSSGLLVIWQAKLFYQGVNHHLRHGDIMDLCLNSPVLPPVLGHLDAKVNGFLVNRLSGWLAFWFAGYLGLWLSGLLKDFTYPKFLLFLGHFSISITSLPNPSKSSQTSRSRPFRSDTGIPAKPAF